MEVKQVIHHSRLKKVNENCLIDNHNQSDKGVENIDAKKDTLNDCYQSQKINMVCLSNKGPRNPD